MVQCLFTFILGAVGQERVEGADGRQNDLRWIMVSGFGAGVAADKAMMGKVSTMS